LPSGQTGDHTAVFTKQIKMWQEAHINP